MAMSSRVLFSLLVFVAIAGPLAEAQTGRIPTARIRGTVYCTTDGNNNSASSPVFRGALVALRCRVGNFSIPTSTALTNSTGNFTIVPILSAPIIPVSYFVNNCSVVVRTPLSSCNASLPSRGGLISSLTYVGNTIINRIFNSTNFVASGFRYEANP